MTLLIRPFGDRGINVELGTTIDELTNLRVHALAERIGQLRMAGIVDLMPTFRALFICYDPAQITVDALIAEVEQATAHLSSPAARRARLLEVPVLYGAEHEAELAEVARIAGLDPIEVVAAHCAEEYLVYMNGSAGGAAFIKMPPKLSGVPRKRTPAIDVPAGTVILAGGVGTAFKSLPGPTGWYAIGKSPLRQWMPEADPPLLILAGDYIRYRPIDAREFVEISGLVREGTYRHAWRPHGVSTRARSTQGFIDVD